MTENEAINVLKMVEAHGCLVIEAKVMAIKALEEVQPYRAIGTVEEFKALKEKNVAKKVIAKKDVDHTFYFCPKCKIVVGNSFTGNISEYCRCCGQKLDWSE